MIERIKNIINPEEKPIDEMSSNEMIELLIKLNKCLRCLDSDEVRSISNVVVNNSQSPIK